MNWTLLKSRKFWALVLAELGAVGGYASGSVPPADALHAALTALEAFILAIALEDGLKQKFR